MKIQVVTSNPLFLTPAPEQEVRLEKEDYLLRVRLLCERMKKTDIDIVVIYGDREHFSNIEYFTGYDCRFEEGLLAITANGRVSVVVGNEGWAYSYQIPYEVERYSYQNFSLQGQPKDKLKPLSKILGEIGMDKETSVGVVGLKYFETDSEGIARTTFDIPAYVLSALEKCCGAENLVNYTRELTGYPNGIRIKLHSAKEIAWAEYAGCRVANAVQRMLKRLKPGISEYELSTYASVGLEAQNVHPMINFGAHSVGLGLKSPLPGQILQVGDVCGVCYSVRGNLTSKISVGAYDLNSYPEELRGYFETFYKAHFAAVAAWYEAACVGAECREMYHAVYRHINHEEHGITLNPGHTTGTEEWLNSAFYEDSTHCLEDGEFLQVDIIASKTNPVRTSICEDAVVIASDTLRAELAAQYPETYGRICARQKAMRETLGIQLSDDVLPMSNLNGVYYPFMLDLSKVLAISERDRTAV